MSGERILPTARDDRESWDQYFLRIACAVSTRATCNRKHVGCVLVKDKRIIATGYNGSIPGHPHCDDAGHDMENSHCVRTVHAEINAITQAARMGISTLGAEVYLNTYPCWDCFKVLATAGVKRIVFTDAYRINERVAKAAFLSNIQIVQDVVGVSR